jgi:hypothetical protein
MEIHKDHLQRALEEEETWACARTENGAAPFTKETTTQCCPLWKLRLEQQLEESWLGFQTHPHGAGDEAAAYHLSPP